MRRKQRRDSGGFNRGETAASAASLRRTKEVANACRTGSTRGTATSSTPAQAIVSPGSTSGKIAVSGRAFPLCAVVSVISVYRRAAPTPPKKPPRRATLPFLRKCQRNGSANCAAAIQSNTTGCGSAVAFVAVLKGGDNLLIPAGKHGAQVQLQDIATGKGGTRRNRMWTVLQQT